MPDLGNQKTIPLVDQALSVGTMGSGAYFLFIWLVTRYSYRVDVGFGLACSLLLAMVGLIIVGCGFQFIRETQAGPDDHVTPRIVPILEWICKNSLNGKKLVLNLDQIRRFEISVFFPACTFFVAAWSSMAYGFAKADPGAYAHPERLSFGLMLGHYVWQVVDMVPLVEVWKSVHIDDPLLETRIWPGLLVVAFRLIVLYVLLAAAAKLFGFGKDKKSGA
jgi:hypothetical protein